MPIKDKKGFILIAVFLIAILLLLLIGAYITSAFTESRATRKNQMGTAALYLAEAAVDRTITDLEAFQQADLTQQQVGYEIFPKSYFSLVNSGGYERRAVISQVTQSGIVVKIESWGHASSASMPALDTTAPEYQMKYIEAFVTVMPNPLFPMALFAQSEIDFNNSLVDSYDSSKGQYGGDNIGNEGDIGSNNVNDLLDVIELRGRSSVKGDATVGPSVAWNQAIEVGNNAQITGTQSNATKEMPLPIATVPGDATPVNLTNVTNQEIYPGGVYSTPSIKISGQGSVQFSGPTMLYVDGDVDISGNGMITDNNLPSNLIVKVVGRQEIVVKISGNSNFYGGIYAPQSEVKISGNGDVFGAVVAKEAEVIGAGGRQMGLHYDETMIRIPGGSGYEVTMVAWRDFS